MSAMTHQKLFEMLSVNKDPHPPNEVREPYQSMYKHKHFKLPHTANTAVRKDPAVPLWQYHDHANVSLNDADEYLATYENSSFYQSFMQQYFGMVKCIDDNVGKLLEYMTEANLNDNTIVV